MAKLLHIIATPRGSESRTLRIANAFLGELKENSPAVTVDTLNVFNINLPAITTTEAAAKGLLLGGQNLDSNTQSAWDKIQVHIDRFLAADAYLFSAPMWNFSIPYQLKHYLDVIVQPKYLFTYTAEGPQGLVGNQPVVVLSTRGGDYGPESQAQAFDLQEPYMRTILSFVGLTDLTFIHGQPMDAGGPEAREQALQQAISAARCAAQAMGRKLAG